MIKRRRLSPPNWNFVPTKVQIKRWRRWNRRPIYTDSVLNLLRCIEAEQQRVVEEDVRTGKPFWLLPFRAAFRRHFQGVDYRFHEGQLQTLRFYLATCPRPMIPICISLMARCADRFRLYELKQFCHDPSPEVRKHLAKALRRLEAWTLLDEMAAAYPGNDAIQWFARAPTSRRSYAERLARYVGSVDASHADKAVGPSRMPYWSLYNPWQGTPPKSVLFIREILLRIRRWVRGGI
jgi:hypothetical protein